MAIIEVEHLTKEFRLGQLTRVTDTLKGIGTRLCGRRPPERRAFKALDDLSFSIEEGEVVGIIGPNGAGKSTLLKILSGITKPTSGRCQVRGKVAPLIEVGAGLVGDLTGRENILLNGSILGLRNKDIKSKMHEIIDFAELEEFIDTPLKKYSSGMKIRLGFSIATTIDSNILIVDEVLAVGDLAFQRKCFDRMESLIRREGRTVLLVSHNIRQVERLCSRVILLDKGRIVDDASPTQVCNRFYEMSDHKVMSHVKSTALGGYRKLSSGDVWLDAVELANDRGEPTDEVHAPGSLQARFDFTVTRDIPKPIFGFGIHTTDFIYLATKQSTGVFDGQVLKPGSYSLKFTTNKLPFLPGVYLVRFGIALGDTFQPVFYEENVASFRIVDPTRSRASLMAGIDGFVDMDGRWDLSFRGH